MVYGLPPLGRDGREVLMGMQVGVGEGRMVGKDPAEWSLKIEHGVEEEEGGGDVPVGSEAA